MKKITMFNGEHRFLSNFYPAEIKYCGLTYPSVEHAYQAAKTTDEASREAIRAAPTAGVAKQLGKKVKVKKKDWDVVKVGIMRILVWRKFKHHDDLRIKLLATGDAELIEGNWWKDTFWGVCNGVGENHLGKILMYVRDELKDHKDEF